MPDLVQLGLPLRWSRNRNSIVEVMVRSGLAAFRAGAIPLPWYQGRTELETSRLASRIISYHTVSTPNERQSKTRLNVKISPFGGYFSFDLKGYSGWADRPENSLVVKLLGEETVRARGRDFLGIVHSAKYQTADDTHKPVQRPGAILVEQLGDDAVAKLRTFANADVEACLRALCARENKRAALRPHPLSTVSSDSLERSVGITSEISVGSVFVTHNSGFAAICAASGGDVVFLADNEFGIEPVRSLGALETVIRDRWRHDLETVSPLYLDVWEIYFGSLVHQGEQWLIDRIVSEFLRAPGG